MPARLCAVPLTVFTLDYLVRYPDHSVRDVAAKVRAGNLFYVLVMRKAAAHRDNGTPFCSDMQQFRACMAQELENVSLTGTFDLDSESNGDVNMSARRPSAEASPSAVKLKAQADLAQLG